MNKDKVFEIFWLFVITSILGYVIEGIYTLYPDLVILNHSAFVIGPFNIIYGFGSIILTILLYRFRNDNIFKIFIISFIAGTLVEYIGSLVTEILLGIKVWDYSNNFLNINGRVSIMYSFFWGILGILWIKYAYPYIKEFIDKINKPIWYKIGVILFIFLIFDACISIHAVYRANERNKNIPAENLYEKFLDKAFPNKFLNITYGNKWSN